MPYIVFTLCYFCTFAIFRFLLFCHLTFFSTVIFCVTSTSSAVSSTPVFCLPFHLTFHWIEKFSIISTFTLFSYIISVERSRNDGSTEHTLPANLVDNSWASQIKGERRHFLLNHSRGGGEWIKLRVCMCRNMPWWLEEICRECRELAVVFCCVQMGGVQACCGVEYVALFVFISQHLIFQTLSLFYVHWKVFGASFWTFPSITLVIFHSNWLSA